MAAADPREVAPVCPELFVPDVGAAIDFYTGKLGFTLYRVDPPGEPGPASEFAILTLGRAVVMFAKDDLYAAMGGSTESPRGVAIDVRIMVDDADAMYNRCRESGVQIVYDIADRYYGLRDFVITDLNGFRLRFAAPLR
ncbi:MAG: hypothetical protein E6I38_04580 [Chloroflexi bacterium]|nr:MAG: hypothetical protein E6I38_04580 [Chloroflexota bacterium]TMG01628.1 MAG: hypothetical protein E6I03_07870 [Chloroflexota bacterium]